MRIILKFGELAAQAGCDVQTVRFYEREGLLEEPDREASGYRREPPSAAVCWTTAFPSRAA